MEFYICATSCSYVDEYEIDELLRDYSQIKKYNPLIKEYQWDWGKGHISTNKGLFIELNSLEELVNFSNKIHKSFIINDNCNMYDMNHKQINTIEIYDDWRE